MGDRQPEPEPEPEPERPEKILERQQKAGRRPREPVSAQSWRHGEIVFEETGTVTKFLLVPDHIEDPEKILQVMLSGWGMPMPSMTITTLSRPRYFDPAGRSKHLADWERPYVWDEFPEQWGRNDAEGQKAAQQKYESRVTEMMYGICRAATESKGWIVHQKEGRVGGDVTGGVLNPGVGHFKEVRQRDARELVNLTFGLKGLVVTPLSDKTDPYHEETPIKQKMREAVALRYDDETAVPLDQSPTHQLIFPRLHEQLTSPDALHRDGTSEVVLSNQCSHIVLTKSRHLNHHLKILTEDIVPHVTVIVGGKRSPGTWNIACRMVTRGAQVILLENSGIVVDQMAQAVKREARRRGEIRSLGLSVDTESTQQTHRQQTTNVVMRGSQMRKESHVSQNTADPDNQLEFPESISPSSFLIFDVLEDSPDEVIEKLTSALATVGGDEMREMGFAQTEQQRLKYAWELVVLFRYNAGQFERYARSLHIVLTLMALLTTVCAVLLTTGNEEPKELASGPTLMADTVTFDEAMNLSPVVKRWLWLGCAVVPMISAFLLALAHKLSYSKRWAMMAMAAHRVCSEIYMYRARVGDFQQRTKNAKLAALVDRAVHAASTATKVDDKPKSQPKVPTKNGRESQSKVPTKNGREIFSDNLLALQSELMASEVKMSSLHKPPPNASKDLLYDTLYPFEQATQQSSLWWFRRCCSRKTSDMKCGTGAYTQTEGSEEAVGLPSSVKQRKVIAPSRTLLLEEGLSDFSLLGTAMEDDAHDDGVGLISAQDYIKFRLLPAISRLNLEVRRHERWYNYAQVSILLATMMASVLGVVELHAWIPAITAAVAGIQSLSSFDDTAARLVGANSALTQLKNLRIWWQSLSRTQQSMPHNKAQLIQSSEDAIESELSAWTQGMLRKKRKVDTAEEEEDTAVSRGARDTAGADGTGTVKSN